MKKPLIALLLILLTTGMVWAQSESSADDAGNLFATHDYHNPFWDRVGRSKGDIITVIISENSSSNYSASTSLSKKDSNFITNGIPLLQGLISALSTGSNSSNAGSGTTTSTGQLTAQMAVEVKDIMPNGNLVIEGQRTITTNRNSQTFVLSGEIRPDDVLSNNTVLSQNIQSFRISVQGEGSIQARQRRGILTRILDWLF